MIFGIQEVTIRIYDKMPKKPKKITISTRVKDIEHRALLRNSEVLDISLSDYTRAIFKRELNRKTVYNLLKKAAGNGD